MFAKLRRRLSILRASEVSVLDNPRICNLKKLTIPNQKELLGLYNRSIPLDIIGKIRISDIKKLSYLKIVEIQAILNREYLEIEDIIQIIHIATGLSYKNLIRKRLYPVMRFFKFVKSGIQEINDMEAANLSYEPSADEVKAGIEELSRFNNLSSVKTIADFMNIPVDQMDRLTWEEAFSILYYNSSINKYEKKYIKVTTKT